MIESLLVLVCALLGATCGALIAWLRVNRVTARKAWGRMVDVDASIPPGKYTNAAWMLDSAMFNSEYAQTRYRAIWGVNWVPLYEEAGRGDATA